MLLVPLVGGGPVYEIGRNFFPLGALGAVVANVIVLDFPLGDDLISAVFEDEALLVDVLRGSGGDKRREGTERRAGREDQDQESDRDETSWAHRFLKAHRFQGRIAFH